MARLLLLLVTVVTGEELYLRGEMIYLMHFAITGKVFQPCQLARQLVSLGVSRSQIPDWLCLVKVVKTFAIVI